MDREAAPGMLFRRSLVDGVASPARHRLADGASLRAGEARGAGQPDGLSQWHFARAFKASTGLSPHRWQLNARIAKAQQLLLSGSMSQAQIALALGFAEQSHLCRVFKQMVGVPPAAWQRDQDHLGRS